MIVKSEVSTPEVLTTPEVSFLLEYANIGCVPGKLKVEWGHNVPELRRPPIDPPEWIKPLTQEEIDHCESMDMEALLKLMFVNYNGHRYIRCEDGKVRYAGKPMSESYPSQHEFEEFFEKHQINTPPNYEDCVKILHEVRRLLLTIVCKNEGGNKKLIETALDYIKTLTLWDYKLQGKGFDGSICRSMVYLWNEHKVHSLIKQCPCCAKFSIKGRASLYCSDKCRVRYNRHVKAQENKYKRDRVKKGHDRVREDIIKWLTREHYERNSEGRFKIVSKLRAIEIYNNINSHVYLPPKARTSMKVFEKWYRSNFDWLPSRIVGR